MSQSPLGNDNNTKEIVLFISHKPSRCGVYEFGINIAQSLKKSKQYTFKYSECNTSQEYYSCLRDTKPKVVIFNYYSVTMPWLSKKLMSDTDLVYVGIMHEVTQEKADSANNHFFDYHIAPDPTLLLKNPIVFKTGRLIPDYKNSYPIPTTPVIGSFGFGLKGKGFEKILSTVQKEYDQAIIKLHIPFAQFGDKSGQQAKTITQHCQSLLKKEGIQLKLSHDFLNKDQLLAFLAENTINVFFYDQYNGRGISSVTDYALAVDRPIAITQSTMFRHLFSSQPSICIENNSLSQIIKNGTQPLHCYQKEWQEDNLIWDYERILNKILSQKQSHKTPSLNLLCQPLLKIKEFFKKQPLNHWVSKQIQHKELIINKPKSLKYSPIDFPEKIVFNRILDNTARLQYKETIDKLFELCPTMMKHKIPEANVQQAFVLDTAHRLAVSFVSPKMLCVGSFMDTAVAGLNALGYQMDEIDPVLNYDLNEFLHKPSTKLSNYDLIISTSVIEHVQDDLLFLKQISELLKPGGIAILTCDYNDQYKSGDPIPSVDFRFYTQNDFKKRLLPQLKDCSLIDSPQWDCLNPDFTYEKYKYTFATLVFQKNKI